MSQDKTTYKRMQELDLTGKRVLIREDLNVPIKDGTITNDARIRAALPSIILALQSGATVILMSHLGRPQEGKPATEQPEFSLQPVAKHLEHLLRTESTTTQTLSDLKVELVPAEHYLTDKPLPTSGPNHITLLENVRFNSGEVANADNLAQAYAALCDIFVMDAFGTAHRAQASTHGVAKYAPVACAGPLLTRELEALDHCLITPEHPLLAVVGGAKVSSKLKLLQNLADKVDQLIVGGGIANTFLAAAKQPIGRSLYEPELLPTARELMKQTNILLPVDVLVGKEFSAAAKPKIRNINKTNTKANDTVQDNDIIFDIGPRTVTLFKQCIADARTILWNGPVGRFEFDRFADGTEAIAKAIATNKAITKAITFNTEAVNRAIAAQRKFIATFSNLGTNTEIVNRAIAAQREFIATFSNLGANTEVVNRAIAAQREFITTFSNLGANTEVVSKVIAAHKEVAQAITAHKEVAQAIAAKTSYSIAGGGETIAAINKFNVANNISYISTGGGALLEYLQGTELPAVQILKERQ